MTLLCKVLYKEKFINKQISEKVSGWKQHYQAQLWQKLLKNTAFMIQHEKYSIASFFSLKQLY